MTHHILVYSGCFLWACLMVKLFRLLYKYIMATLYGQTDKHSIIASNIKSPNSTTNTSCITYSKLTSLPFLYEM